MKARRKPRELTVAMLRDSIRYDPETGDFRWIKPRARWMNPGAPAGTVGCHRKALLIGIYGRRYYAHRLAWLYMTGDWPRGVIDHKNGDPLDNRFSNLRDVSSIANQQNMHRRPKGSDQSLPFGVTRTTNGVRFTSHIRVNGEHHYLGCFKTKEEAHDAYISAKRKLHDLPEGWEPA